MVCSRIVGVLLQSCFVFSSCVRMGRKCSVVGCSITTGIHDFPKSLECRRQWLRAIGFGDDRKPPVDAGVCNKLFTRDSFSNYCKVQMGFGKQLRLIPGAVPTLALTQPTPPPPMEAAHIQRPIPKPPVLILHPPGAPLRLLEVSM